MPSSSRNSPKADSRSRMSAAHTRGSSDESAAASGELAASRCSRASTDGNRTWLMSVRTWTSRNPPLDTRARRCSRSQDGKRGPHHRASLRARVPFQRVSDRTIDGRMVNRPQHGDRHAAPIREDAPDFTHDGRRLGHELERLLARDHIEGPILEGQARGVARLPRNRGNRSLPTPPAPPSTCPRFRSRPVTDPRGPTRSAARRATMPVPHPTSRMRSAGCTPARSSTRSAIGAKMMGTR